MVRKLRGSYSAAWRIQDFPLGAGGWRGRPLDPPMLGRRPPSHELFGGIVRKNERIGSHWRGLRRIRQCY